MPKPKLRKASPDAARNRWIAIGAAGVIAALGVYLTVRDKPAPKTEKVEAAEASVDAAADAGLLASGDPLDEPDANPFDQVGNIDPDDHLDSGFGLLLPDGAPVPSLPDKSPRSVRFGVVLVTYAGAQGAPPDARSKNDARALAEKLAAEAKTDFHAAVGHGDPGSSDDLGRIPRGTLELAPEYVLFTLPPGQTSDPIDTPRGFWIVKRTE